MNHLREQKAELRRAIAAVRDALPARERAAADEAIRARVLALPEWAAARTLFLYVSFRSEVSTEGILAAALESGRTVLVPRVDRERHEMDACRIASRADLAPGVWGILEAVGPATDPARIDLALVPGLAFDRQGRRLGYGAGYYDRYLRRTRPECARVALAYEAQILPAVPAGPGDEAMHAVVTEAAVYRTGRCC